MTSAHHKPGSGISKVAENVERALRPSYTFQSGRNAFQTWLEAVGVGRGDRVLLPAYIGWSSREGSGVFDPIHAVGADAVFYRVTRTLAADVEHLTEQLRSANPKALVVIHYFGFAEPSTREICRLARSLGVPVLEDEAHAMYSDLVGNACGREGDACIFSLHKLLPVPWGGALVLNDRSSALASRVAESNLRKDLPWAYRDYDFAAIAATRVANARTILSLLPDLAGKVDPLYREIPAGIVPQTLPVIITDKSRDELYFAMNERGFGVVSLYHTLISEIAQQGFPDSHWLAHRILNLPVHQDVGDEGCIREMMATLSVLVNS